MKSCNGQEVFASNMIRETALDSVVTGDSWLSLKLFLELTSLRLMSSASYNHLPSGQDMSPLVSTVL